VSLELLNITFRNGFFRYFHKRDLEPEPEMLYTLDEMADDLNADKLLASISNANSNLFYSWIENPPGKRIVSTKTRSYFDEFANLANQIMGKNNFTKIQRGIVAERNEDPVFIVQGPPGTGKSFTLSWAILARMAVAAREKRPFRVLISCKTHNSIRVVLEQISKQKKRLSQFPLPQFPSNVLKSASVYKVVNDEYEDNPDGVQNLQLFSNRGEPLEEVCNDEYFVIGATPGGVYNMMRYRSLGGRDIEWQAKLFDLVVIDEASQMSIPEGVLAGAFLRNDGQVIVVGDHRQMPPILTHDWDEEPKRIFKEYQPFLSLFEYLMEKGFPREALDRSFRLHKVIAEFLNENIYSHDGIEFYSRKKDLLAAHPVSNEFLRIVLDPKYPIVVIEHDEYGSHQYNETEVEIVKPIIEQLSQHMMLSGIDGMGVVVPHRAQKAILRQIFPELAQHNSIDTVERFQGGERDVIILSATASDPDYVLAEADFLVNLNRLNVAISRPRKKLIVVASSTVVDLLTSDIEVFENSLLWKKLYYQYADSVLYSGVLNGSNIVVKGKEAVM
jgi:hypothetical protein